MDATMTGTTPGPKHRESSGYSDLHQSRKLKLRPEESVQSRELEDRSNWATSSEHGEEAAEDVRRAHSRLNLHRPLSSAPPGASAAAPRATTSSVDRPVTAPSRRFETNVASSADLDHFEGGFPGLSQQVSTSAPSQSDNAVQSMNNVKLAQLTKENATLRAELAAMRASELQLRDRFQEEVDNAVAQKTKQKDAEINKLREALRVSERQVKASLKHNTAKKERDEVQVLQQTISKLKQDLTARCVGPWRATPAVF
jgi:small-conductance mechanosensitive channel